MTAPQIVSTTTLILMTKTFPYGHQETYLLNELPFLTQSFDKVIVVPYDEFKYDPKENRINSAEVHVFNINQEAARYRLSLNEKIERELNTWSIFLFEVFKGREPWNHLRFYKRNLSQLRHSYLSAACLKEYLLKESNDKILFYNYWLHGGIIISDLCRRLLRNKKISIVSRAHAYDVYHKDWYTIFPESKYVFLGFETWKMYHADKIYTISQHGYNHFLRLFPKLRNKLSVSRLGVLDAFTQKKFTDEAITGPITIVSCSNIDSNKRVYRIPEILARMKQSVKWIHFGKGEEQAVRQVQQRIEHYKLSGSCDLKGFVPNNEVITFYKNNRVDLFINLSRIEGIPVSLMEAASFGIPLMATKTVGNPEIVNDSNGFLIDVDFDSEQISEMLNIFFADTAVVAQKRKNSRHTFEEHYNAARNYPEFTKQLKDIAFT